MSRRPAHFTQADVARALRAIEQTGAAYIIELAPDGCLRLIPAALAGDKLGTSQTHDHIEDEPEIIL